MNPKELIGTLFKSFSDIRYVAIYSDDTLVLQQRENISNSSSSDSDKFEELLVNPTLLKLANQRGNIDCGGLDYIVVKYGNFFQFIADLPNGHISLGLEKNTDINLLPNEILDFLDRNDHLC